MKWKRNLSWQRKRSDPKNLSPKVRTRCQCYKTFFTTQNKLERLSPASFLRLVLYLCVWAELTKLFYYSKKLEQSSNLAPTSFLSLVLYV
jgi:hypothetical protein